MFQFSSTTVDSSTWSRRTNLRTLKRSRKPFSSTVNRGCRGEACGAIGNTVRAPCPSLPLCDPKKPTGAYLAVAFLKS